MALKHMTIAGAKSNVSFSIKKLGLFSVKGSINDIKGDVSFDEKDLENSHFNVSVSPITIDTGNTKRDEHLKSNDFFYVKDHPKIDFRTNTIQKKDDVYYAKGELTILSTTRSITIPFSYNEQSFSGNFSLNRLDFELGKKFPAFVVGKTVQININCKIK